MGTIKKTESKRVRSTLKYPKGAMEPEDFLRFVQDDSFAEDWSRLGLDDEDLEALEILIMISPTRNPVVQGTGGLRTIRFSSKRWRRGKSGGVRVGYAYFPRAALVTLHVAYGKNESDNLSPKQRKAIKGLIQAIEAYLDSPPQKEVRP